MRNFITLAIILLSYLSNAQAPGSLDLSFGNNGIVTTSINYSSRANAVAVQSDGKILVAGIVQSSTNNSDFFCARYNQDGSLDNTFGASGVLITDIEPTVYEEAKSLAVQNDGKITVAGRIQSGAAMVRYNSDGTIDSSFGIAGIVTVTNGGSLDVIKIDPITNKIIGGGLKNIGAPALRGCLYRFESNGSLDTSFNSTGFLLTPSYLHQGTYLQTEIKDLEVDENGKITGVGKAYFYFGVGNIVEDWVCRVNTDGSMDTTFSNDGMNIYSNFVTVPPFSSVDEATSLILNSDSSIIMAGNVFYGSSNRSFKIYKIESNGLVTGPSSSLNVNFGLLTDCKALEKDNNEKYILAGSGYSSSSTENFVLTAINPNFSIDTSFGLNGKVITPFDNITVSNMVLQNDNKIILAGYDYSNSGTSNIVLARYNGTGSLANETFTQDEFSFYPNPSQQSVFFKTNNQEVIHQKFQIYDANGRIVSNGVIDSIEMEINISQLENGIYFLKVDHYSSSYKLIKN